jgi:hypothetical protein
MLDAHLAPDVALQRRSAVCFRDALAAGLYDWFGRKPFRRQSGQHIRA